jgi:small-conductance mechanosensitive channel
MAAVLDFFEYLLENPWLQRLLLLGGGLLLGMTGELLVRRLRRVARASRWSWDDLLVESLRGMPLTWGMLWGTWSALAVGGFPVESGGIDWVRRGQKVLEVLFLASLVLVAMRVTGGLVRGVSDRAGGAIPSPTLVTNLAQILVAILGAVFILQNQGIQITPILTALGIGGLAVALALQDTLGNLFAGVQIILGRQIRARDYVRLESGEMGMVTDVKARSTTVRTFPDGNQVIVPNSRLATSVVKNFSLPEERLWISIGVGVSYGSDLEQVEAVTLAVAREASEAVEGTAPEEPPVFRYEGFGDSSIDFQVRIRCREFAEQFLVRHEFIKRLHRRYASEGINIPFPIRTLDLPPGFTAPPPGGADGGGANRGGESA